jgi:hypothetical protein
MGSPAVIAGHNGFDRSRRKRNGMLTWDEIESVLHINSSSTLPTGFDLLVNTHNFGGGSVMSAEQTNEICDRSARVRLPVHLDGARVLTFGCLGEIGRGDFPKLRFGAVLFVERLGRAGRLDDSRNERFH